MASSQFIPIRVHVKLENSRISSGGYQISWRVTASGFIMVVIFANLWLARALSGSPVMPVWLASGMVLGLLTAAGGGVGLGLAAWRRYVENGVGNVADQEK